MKDHTKNYTKIERRFKGKEMIYVNKPYNLNI